MPHPTTEPTVNGSVLMTPAIEAALRTARAVHFRLEDEFHAFDWLERLENAAMLREIDAPEELRGLVTVAQFRLESEAFDFSNWGDRAETIALVHAVIVGLKATQPKEN
jgi:hypothetical protein